MNRVSDKALNGHQTRLWTWLFQKELVKQLLQGYEIVIGMFLKGLRQSRVIKRLLTFIWCNCFLTRVIKYPPVAKTFNNNLKNLLMIQVDTFLAIQWRMNGLWLLIMFQHFLLVRQFLFAYARWLTYQVKLHSGRHCRPQTPCNLQWCRKHIKYKKVPEMGQIPVAKQRHPLGRPEHIPDPTIQKLAIMWNHSGSLFGSGLCAPKRCRFRTQSSWQIKCAVRC